MSNYKMLSAVLMGVILVASGVVVNADDTKQPVRVAGQLTKIDGKTVTISSEGKDTVINCTDATKLSRDGNKSGEKMTLADFKVGESVRAYYDKENDNATALIIASPTTASSGSKDSNEKKPIRLVGELTKIDGNTLTISSDGATVVVTCNDGTKFGRDGEPNAKLTLADFKAGEHIRTYYDKDNSVASLVMIAKPGSR